MTGGMSLWQMLFDLFGRSLLIALMPVYLFALIKGDKTDRLCVHVLAIGAVLNVMLALHQQGSGQRLLYRADQLGVDIALLAAQMFIATRSSRRHPIFIAAAQLIIVLTGLLDAVGLIALRETLSVLIGFAATIQLGAFAWGLTIHQARRRIGAKAGTFAH